MERNEYLDNLMAELATQGIEPPNIGNSTVTSNIDDKELQVILAIERITGKKFSDEQRKILEHHGNACILACAGSGKTTTSVNLIAKRIMTGEIKDVNKLIYATFSKSGADEMRDRLNTLLKQLGMSNINVQVRTLHAFFLSVINTFGLNKEILKAGERTKMIRQACRDADFPLKDDELMIVDNLISYQVNNLLTNKKLVDSYVNTLEDLTVEKFGMIVNSYKKQKASRDCMDYDDMQYYLWMWLVKWRKSDNEVERQTADSVRDYCKAVYTDFYIDEAQDVSKIQYEIIKAIVTDPNDKNKLDKNLVFIGDDDQCLPGDTMVYTKRGPIKIEDVKLFDKVLSAIGNGELGYVDIDNIKKTRSNEDTLKIKTKSGRELTCTWSHKLFVNRWYDNYGIASLTLFGGEVCNENGIKSSSFDANDPDGNNYYMESFNLEALDSYGKKLMPCICHKKHTYSEAALLLENSDKLYRVMRACELSVGDYIPTIVTSDNLCKSKIINDLVVSIEEDETEAYVYDLSVPSTRNFVANDVIVHNCIYKWRGSDPSIILTIGPQFNMQTFVLSTNYRCLNEIVDYAAVGIRCNNSRFDKSMNAFSQGGNVKIFPSAKEDLCSLSILAMNQIKHWIANGDNVRDIAVLSRNNFHLALLSNMLLREGIYCNLTEDMKLTKSYMYSDVKDIISLSETTWGHELTAKILWRLCRYMGTANARAIAKFQDTCALSLEDTLGWLLKHFVDKNMEFSKKLSINLQAEQQMQYQIGKLSNDTLDDMRLLYKALTLSDREEKVRTLLFQYLQASSFMYKSKDKNRSITGLVQYVINLMKKDGIDKMLDFMRVTEQLEGGKMVIPGDKLTLSTIHSAKGREWKDVIMFACDNVSQPSFDGIRGMVEDDIPIHDIFESIDEERRLFYVGNTRAKENLFVITYLQPSVFILEALGAFGASVGGNDATILELVDDKQWAEKYSSVIKNNIYEPSSKYYYNPEDLNKA